MQQSIFNNKLKCNPVTTIKTNTTARILRVIIYLASCPLQQNTFIVNYE